jgi:hypothetical protein
MIRHASARQTAHCAGAILVASSLGVEPKRLGCSAARTGPPTHFAHRLGANQFVCNLIAATLPDPRMGVTAWDSTCRAAARLDSAGLSRLCGPTRASSSTLPQARSSSARAQAQTPPSGQISGQPRRALADARHNHDLLRDAGPLSRVWESIADPTQPPLTLGELPASHALGPADPACALGRRCRTRRPGWVVDALVGVLGDRGEPMRAREIHAAVETMLGEAVAWSSVKGALASNVSAPRRDSCGWQGGGMCWRVVESSAGGLAPKPSTRLGRLGQADANTRHQCRGRGRRVAWGWRCCRGRDR